MIEQEPCATVVAAAGTPAPLIVKLIVVPAGRVREAACRRSTFTCAVNVCGWPTRFVAFGGVIWMFASTKVLTASPELPFGPSVATVSGKPPTWSVAVA